MSTNPTSRRRRPAMISAFGITRSVDDWSRESGILPTTLGSRINRGRTPEEALTLPGRTGDYYVPDAQLLGKPVQNHLIIGKTRPLLEEDIRAIRSNLTLYACLEGANANKARITEAARETTRDNEEWSQELSLTGTPHILRLGKPFRDVSIGECVALKLAQDYSVAVKVTEHPEHNVLILGRDAYSWLSEDFLHGIRKALLDEFFPVGPKLLVFQGEAFGDNPAPTSLSSSRPDPLLTERKASPTEPNPASPTTPTKPDRA